MTDLIPFDIEKLKAGYECFTQDKEYKLVNYYVTPDDDTRVYRLNVCLKNIDEEGEYLNLIYKIDGARYDNQSDSLTLMLKPKTEKLWIAVCKIREKDRQVYFTSDAYLDENFVRVTFPEKDFAIKEIEVEL